MNITCDPPDNDRLTEMPVIPPPTPRRSPLISGTYKLKGDSNAKPDSKSSSAVHPLTKSAKKTIALLTVSASIVGAFSTIAGFAHSVAPQSIPQPAFTGIATGASILLDHDSIGGPLSALSETGKPLGLCPLQHTTMDAKLSGYVARVNVTQVFTNPYPYKIDARYNFPLSDDSAVDEMTIKVGDRTIKGDIKTREQAKQIYEQAKNGGHAAALLDQERTNIFTQQVANIEPGKSIVVQISYVELLKFEDGRYTFALPTTVAPRFFPEIDHVHAFPKPPNNWGQTLALPGVLSGQNLSINVDIDAGLPIKNISSKSFPVLVDQVNSSHSLVSLKQSVNVPNKDFVLTYELDKADSIKSGYLTYRNDQAKDKDGYATFMVLPPAKVTPASAAPKEMIFLVDCSGSQAGRPLDKAKETLDYIVDHMNSNDTFQVLAFNSEVDTLSDAPLKAGVEEKMRAHYFINNLTAQGGTWMAPAVERVLRNKQSDDKEPKRLRIVTFMTDGFVGNDLEIMKLVQKERGDSRWFVFGTGESVNRALIDNVSRLGGGEAEYVLLTSSAEEVGKSFTLAYPALPSPMSNSKPRA
jgi:Ca-activated chloride channel homolog